MQSGLATKSLCDAILKFDATGSTLTGAHLVLVRLSLEFHAYAEALPVIDQPIIYFQVLLPQSKPKALGSLPSFGSGQTSSGFGQKLRYQDVLEYFLGVGTIYIGLQQWAKALDALENAITYPVKDNAVSKIMTDAYKKWVLVKILLEGRAGGLPNITNAHAAKTYHTIAKPYEMVANLFQTASADRLRQEVMAGDNIWQDDANTGLMLLVLAAYQKFQIRALADVYGTLSISDITHMTESAEPGDKAPSDESTEALISEMIASGALHASLSHSSSPDSPLVLTFSPTGLILSEQEVKARIAASLMRVKDVSGDIKSTDKRLTQDKEYLKYAKNQKKMAQNNGGGLLGEDMMWSGANDEDLMGSDH